MKELTYRVLECDKCDKPICLVKGEMVGPNEMICRECYDKMGRLN